ncbi:MAG TPA: type II toxin-antitoxin system RelE/ParE family toxin [Devosia sp.]|jgi:plasmid stabilization system protein ParE|nr:type II toxin-antitoxin system RelE/ParE family toxin [Devosia sp.]
MEVRITATAEAELEAISSFIGEDNPARAESFGRELLDRCFGLSAHPRRYPVATVWAGREFRRCRHGNYLIFYSIVNGDLVINHIVHSARDYVRLLFPEG